MPSKNSLQLDSSFPTRQTRSRLSTANRLFARLMVAFVALSGMANAQERLPTIPPAQYNEAQRQAAAEFLEARKYPVRGPFEPMMHSPEVMTRARAMGDYLRYKSGIGNTLSEFAILITARDWSQSYEWSVHAPVAAKAGIKPEIIAAIRDGRRPDGMSSDETIVYNFATELLQNRQVSDPTFAAAEARFGKLAVVDLVSILGYYTFNAMVLSVARYPVKEGPTLPRYPN
jgi:4-carboxymuconolactone decarboxylase